MGRTALWDVVPDMQKICIVCTVYIQFYVLLRQSIHLSNEKFPMVSVENRLLYAVNFKLCLFVPVLWL